jgi:hypothetical protein
MNEKITRFASIIKFHLEGNLGVMIIIVLVGLGGFGLGRLSSANEEGSAAVQIVNQEASVSSATIRETSGVLVGSINGSKYHFPWCPGAKQMKEENKVWFDSVEEAERAGYTPAANCKGL